MGAPTPGYGTSSDEKTWALVSHFGGAGGTFISGGVAGWIAPLIALVAKGNENPTFRAHAVSALNFQILVTLVSIVGYLTICIGIGFVIIAAACIVGIVFGILAGVKANEGLVYKYPLTLPLVK